jgi:hypothetical protein
VGERVHVDGNRSPQFPRDQNQTIRVTLGRWDTNQPDPYFHQGLQGQQVTNGHGDQSLDLARRESEAAAPDCNMEALFGRKHDRKISRRQLMNLAFLVLIYQILELLLNFFFRETAGIEYNRSRVGDRLLHFLFRNLTTKDVVLTTSDPAQKGSSDLENATHMVERCPTFLHLTQNASAVQSA